MRRDGAVRTALTFKERTRCEGVYETPMMRFEVCVYTEKVVNAIEQNGTLTLDYVSELKGAEPERTRLTVAIEPAAQPEKA